MKEGNKRSCVPSRGACWRRLERSSLGGLRFAEVADDECHLTWGEHFCRWVVAASFQSLDELCVTLYPVHQVGGGGMYGATVGKVEHGKLGLAVGLDSELVHTLFCFFDET